MLKRVFVTQPKEVRPSLKDYDTKPCLSGAAPFTG